MEYRFVNHEKNSYLECLPGGGQIASERDAVDMVGACGEHQARRLLLYGENLAEDFFNLRTGLAGAVLLKLSMYRIKTAAVLTTEQVNHGRFKDMVLEANRGNRLFHVFYDRETAEAWLVEE